MMSWLPLGFATPAILAALALLPAIWWLLRLTPPRPQRVAFPPTRLLAEIAHKDETPAKSPWWLTLLRLLLAAAVIVALAGPMWRPDARTAAGSGAVALIIDNGWASGPDWDSRARAAAAVLDGAARTARPVILAATADGPGQDFAATAVETARERLAALQPEPWPTDRAALVAALRTAFAQTPPGEIVLVSDRVAGADDGFAALLAATGAPVTILSDQAMVPTALTATENAAESLKVRVVRLPGGPDSGSPAHIVRALDGKGFELGTANAVFAKGQATAQAEFQLPTQLRNDIARFEIAGERSAAAVRLVDDRWRRRSVGLLAGGSTDTAQPLLSPLHYLSEALAPFADVREPKEPDVPAAVNRLLDEGVSVIALADIGRLTGQTHEALKAWVERGGVLVRFAGPRLAAATDDLVPVRLRQGGRVLGGTLSWETPQPLASYSADGPFAGLKVPSDVSVRRQVLAEPDAELNERTWASLGDGTPLVTAQRLGAGWLVLFHITADTAWSNLPLSGAFVDMLQRIVALSSAAGASNAGGTQALPPLRVLDGEGRLLPPGPDVQPLPPTAALDGGVGPAHPPGLYGAENAFRALNLMTKDATIAPFDLGPLAASARQVDYASAGPLDLKPWILAAAMVLMLIDGIAVLLIAGAPRWRRRATAAGMLLAVMAASSGIAPPPAAAAETVAQAAPAPADQQAAPAAKTPAPPLDAQALAFAEQATTATRLAYVVTGNQEIDEESRQGLNGLTQFLAERTALEGGTPVGVDLAKDELAFFPLLYWPIDPNAAKPSAQTMARVDAYMRNGGTILFDTRDALTRTQGGATSPEEQKLRELLDGLDVPALEPVPSDHVLTKSFYLLKDFPGRYAGSPLWVEALEPQAAEGDPTDRPVRSGDGVSPILITGNDMAGAWALSDAGDWAYPTVPADPDQREHAIRAGINVVMYTLTGNYKADQVHVPALLERLGQ